MITTKCIPTRSCHACNQPIAPLSGCVGRFGDDDLRHYHTACFAGVAIMKPEPNRREAE